MLLVSKFVTKKNKIYPWLSNNRKSVSESVHNPEIPFT